MTQGKDEPGSLLAVAIMNSRHLWIDAIAGLLGERPMSPLESLASTIGGVEETATVEQVRGWTQEGPEPRQRFGPLGRKRQALQFTAVAS